MERKDFENELGSSRAIFSLGMVRLNVDLTCFHGHPTFRLL